MGEANQSEDSRSGNNRSLSRSLSEDEDEDEDANTYHTAGRAGTSIIIGTTSTVSSTFCQ